MPGTRFSSGCCCDCVLPGTVWLELSGTTVDAVVPTPSVRPANSAVLQRPEMWAAFAGDGITPLYIELDSDGTNAETGTTTVECTATETTTIPDPEDCDPPGNCPCFEWDTPLSFIGPNDLLASIPWASDVAYRCDCDYRETTSDEVLGLETSVVIEGFEVPMDVLAADDCSSSSTTSVYTAQCPVTFCESYTSAELVNTNCAIEATVCAEFRHYATAPSIKFPVGVLPNGFCFRCGPPTFTDPDWYYFMLPLLPCLSLSGVGSQSTLDGLVLDKGISSGGWVTNGSARWINIETDGGGTVTKLEWAFQLSEEIERGDATFDPEIWIAFAVENPIITLHTTAP